MGKAQPERTLLLVLPTGEGEPEVDGVEAALRERNFAILGQKKQTLSVPEAEEFYAEHDGTPEFGKLVAGATSGPSVVFALELPNVIMELEALSAIEGLPALHVSKPEDAERELKAFFPEAFPKEVSFALLKPDVSKEATRLELIMTLESKGFVVVAEEVGTLTLDRARALLPEASSQELEHVTSDPSCLLALEKPFAIGDLASLVGPADPAAAREQAPGSMRALFGTDPIKNALEVSSSLDEAGRQLGLAFGAHAFARGRDERTVALVLPEANSAARVDAAVAALKSRGFKVLSTRERTLKEDMANKLLPGVDPDLVKYAQSGACTAICVSRPHAVRALASITGPAGKAVTSTLSAALGFETVPENRTPVVAPATAAVAASAVSLLFPELEEMQTTLAIIKPDAVAAGHAEEIVQRAMDAGFTVRARTSLTLPRFKAEAFYAEHKGKPFVGKLVDFMSSGPCVALALARPGAIAEWRALMGPTRTAQAREQAPGSLRALFGTDNTMNATHGSDAPTSARREVKFFFPALSVEPLPTAEEVAVAVKDTLEPTLITALTEMCKAKPEEPVRWLGNYLLAHNPNKPKVAQLVVPVAAPPPPAKKIVPDAKVIHGLRKYFDELDQDENGSLNLAEFKAAEMSKLGITLPDIDFVKSDIFALLDVNQDSRVTWPEFKAGLLERAADLCFDSRVSLYRTLFGEGDYAGARTIAELQKSFGANEVVLKSLFGEDLPSMLEVFQELDKDGSGAVTWDEFVDRIEGAFRPRAPIAHRERIAKRAPPPLVAPKSAPPPPAV